MLIDSMKICLAINCKQCVKLRNGEINFTNYSRRWAAPFIIYDNFKSVLKIIKRPNRNNTSYAEKYQEHIMLMKLFALTIDLANQLLSIEIKILSIALVR